MSSGKRRVHSAVIMTTGNGMQPTLSGRQTLRCVSGVTLTKYSVPQICGVREERPDPSLWFKVLVVDAVLVDCDNKNVVYNCTSPADEEDIHGYRESALTNDLVLAFFQDKERVFVKEEYPECDPIFDDLFNTAVAVLQDLSIDADHVTKYEHLFKLLHVFILPKIKLTSAERAAVEKVLVDIEKFHVERETEIQMALKSERNTENSLNEQTKQLVRKEEEFCRPSYVAACHHEFIGIFLERLDKYIAKCRDDLQVSLDKIEPLRDSDKEDEIKRLKLLRSERRLVQEGFDKALVVREEIRKNINVHSSVHEHLHQLSFGFQNSYVKTYRCLQMRQEELPKMIRTKIKISAVREAVILSLKEIDNDGYSYGYNRAKGSFEAESNLLDINQVPDEWTSLPAKVKHLLEDPEIEFRSQHSQFCEVIRNKCQQLLNMSGAGGLKPGNFLLHDGSGSNCFSSRWSSGSISKQNCESICKEITDHISEFAEKLSLSDGIIEEFRANQQRTLDKVNLCYGEKVTAELVPILSRVYEESYRSQSRDLSNFLASAVFHEVFSGEFKMLNKVMPKQDRRPSFKTTGSRPGSSYDGKHVYEAVSYDDQPVSLPPKQPDSEYESMANIRDRKGQRNTCAIIPKGENGTETEPAAGGKDSRRSLISSFLRKGGDTRRKRHGVSITQEQADKMMNTDGWFDKDGYVDMNILSRSNRSSTFSLNNLHAEFKDFKLLVKEEIDASSMNSKLRSMTGILRYVETRLSDLKTRAGDSEPSCADDLISVIILLLLDLDSEDLLRLYAHINLLDQLCPAFMMGNIHTYALVTLQGPYLMLFEQSKLRQGR